MQIYARKSMQHKTERDVNVNVKVKALARRRDSYSSGTAGVVRSETEMDGSLQACCSALARSGGLSDRDRDGPYALWAHVQSHEIRTSDVVDVITRFTLSHTLTLSLPHHPPMMSPPASPSVHCP